jgi:hypothetical protein
MQRWKNGQELMDEEVSKPSGKDREGVKDVMGRGPGDPMTSGKTRKYCLEQYITH